jgi:hypothetical protein
VHVVIFHDCCDVLVILQKQLVENSMAQKHRHCMVEMPNGMNRFFSVGVSVGRFSFVKVRAPVKCLSTKVTLI